MIDLRLGDCLEIIPTLDKVDCIITSPPYEDIVGAGYSGNKKDVLFLKLYSDFINKLFHCYYDVLKEGGQIFFNVKSKTFNKTLRTPHWLEFTEGFQLFDFKSYIIWKYAGSFDSTNQRYHLDYEIIYHLSKGDIEVFNNEEITDSLTSVWYVPHNIPAKERLHPTQMPVALADRIFKNIDGTGKTILDNFMGSGTTIVSAIKNGHNAIGIELNPNYFELAKQRIEEAKFNLTLSK